MIIKSKKAIIFQTGLMDTDEKVIKARFGAIQSVDMMVTGKIGFQVMPANPAEQQVQTPGGNRMNILGTGVFNLDRTELGRCPDNAASVFIEKLVEFFLPKNPGLSISDFEEVTA